MSGILWTKFFWSDWDTDPALRLCSFSAQGLWMRMLCIASAHDPIGYVAVAGRALDETSIARMTGGLESEVRDLLGELERNGVFSRDRQGRIFSRRMVKDAKRAAIARKNGKKGGNPSLGKGEGISRWDNPSDNTPLKPQEPDARSQKEEEATLPVARPSREPWVSDPHFAAAWDACTPEMRKRAKSKAAAWLEWTRAIKREDPGRIADGVRRYVRTDPDVRRTGGPGFQRWLRDSAWESCTDDARPATQDGPVDPAVMARRMRRYADTGVWELGWGPMPPPKSEAA